MAYRPLYYGTKAGLPARTTAGYQGFVTDSAPGLWATGASGIWYGINGEVINVKHFATGGTGTFSDPYVGWDTAITAVGWKAGACYWFTAEYYGFNTLSITNAVTLRGSGWDTLNSDNFGGAWLTGNLGTVLLSTATTGPALNLVGGPGNYYGFGLHDMMIVGPGSGTSTGVSCGTATIASVYSNFSNLLIANFYLGCDLTNVEDSNFNFVTFNGTVTSLRLGLNTNQNVFTNTIMNHTTTGVYDVAGVRNLFNGGLIQEFTTGFRLSGEGITIQDFYAESAQPTPVLFNIDSTSVGVKGTTISRSRASIGGAGTFLGFTGANTVNYLTTTMNLWDAASVVTIPANVINGISLNDDFLVTNNSSNFLVVRGGVLQTSGTIFASLPTGVSGMEATITDGPAAPAWGDVVAAGGGATLRKLLYRGGAWHVIG